MGNVSADARPEIVLGITFLELVYGPTEPDNDSRLGGALEIFTLSGSGGATTTKVKELTQDSKGVPGSNEAFDGFGRHDLELPGSGDHPEGQGPLLHDWGVLHLRAEEAGLPAGEGKRVLRHRPWPVGLPAGATTGNVPVSGE